MFGLEVLSIAAVTPSLVMVWTAMLYFGLGGGLIAAALVGPLFVATVCVLVALGRRCVLPRTPIGVQPARCFAFAQVNEGFHDGSRVAGGFRDEQN